MNRISLLSLFISLFLLSACLPASAAYSSDPELAAIEARAQFQRATVMANRTQEAEIARARATEVEQARRDKASEKEIALIEARAEERRQEVALQATEVAIWSAEATATAAPQATAKAELAFQPFATATAEALVGQVRRERNAQSVVLFSQWAWPIVGMLSVLIIALSIGRYFDIKARALDRKNSVLETRAGTLVEIWDPELEEWYWQPVGDVSLIRRLKQPSQATSAPAVEFSPGGITAVSAIDHDRRLVIALVNEAIRVSGEDSATIPSWRQLRGWTSSRWAKAVEWLKNHEAVKTIEREGTYLNYESLSDLLFALETGQLSPTPDG